MKNDRLYRLKLLTARRPPFIVPAIDDTTKVVLETLRNNSVFFSIDSDTIRKKVEEVIDLGYTPLFIVEGVDILETYVFNKVGI